MTSRVLGVAAIVGSRYNTFEEHCREPGKPRVLEKAVAFSLQLTNETATPRECGACKACCTMLGVTELHKPVNAQCEHVCEQGCSIYDDRPQTCRNWSCDWKNGLIPGEELRPDKLGVIFDLRLTGCDPILCMWEVAPGAAEQTVLGPILANVYLQAPCAVMTLDGSAYDYWSRQPIARTPYAG